MLAYRSAVFRFCFTTSLFAFAVSACGPQRMTGNTDGASEASFDASSDARPDVVAPDVGRDSAPEAGCSGRLCGANCVDTQTDVRNCGRCGNDCQSLSGVDPMAVRCMAGLCVLRGACRTGLGDCDNNDSNGCETLLTTPVNCGACGTACSGMRPVCTAQPAPAMGHACAANCAPGTTLCTGSCADITRDPAHCGGCDRACPAPVNATATCADSACSFTCNAGFHRCDDACVSNSAVATCGMSCTPCTAPANASATCDGTMCGFTCNEGFADCDRNPANGCEANLRTSATCGSCTTMCSGATPYCETMGTTTACGSRCPSGATMCGTTCVDTRTDVQHCGACSRACPVPANAVATCTAGTCGFTCRTGFHRCGDACVSNTDPATCGMSCMPCPSPAGGTATCDGTMCGTQCPANTHLCGMSCASDTAPESCGTSCTPCAVPMGGMATCSNRMCTASCATGFMLQGGACVDINECATNNGGCDARSSCTNTPGGRTCGNCPAGFSTSRDVTGATICADINECTSNTHNCDANAVCTNNPPGTFTCTCRMGYMGAGIAGTCSDINECLPGGGATCPMNSTCQNAPGSYTCNCNSGFQSDGMGGCVAAGGCSTNPCGANASGCMNVSGGYQCMCMAGYSAPAMGGTCTNIDDCASNPCGSNATSCMDLVGGYRCTCASGYSAPAMGGSCTNVNECMAGTHNCVATATCMDTPGSFTCMCPMGSTGDGRMSGTGCTPTGGGGCNASTCSGNGTCAPTGPNGFTCTCNAGFFGLHCQEMVATVAEWGFTSYTSSPTTAPPTMSDPDAMVGSITRGAGIANASAGRSFNSTGFSTSSTLTTSNNDYMEFVLTPNTGFVLNLTQISLVTRRSGSGPQNWALRSSLDGFTANLFVAMGRTDTTAFTDVVTLPSTFTNIGAVTFRVYGWNSDLEAGTFRFGDGSDVATANRVFVRGAVTSTTP